MTAHSPLCPGCADPSHEAPAAGQGRQEAHDIRVQAARDWLEAWGRVDYDVTPAGQELAIKDLLMAKNHLRAVLAGLPESPAPVDVAGEEKP